MLRNHYFRTRANAVTMSGGCNSWGAVRVPRIFWCILSLIILESFGGRLAAAGEPPAAAAKTVTLTNVSYDPTRELYGELNKMFSLKWKAQTGQELVVNQSHGGSGKQARAVIDGLEADVVTLALAYDIDAIAREAKLLPLDWQTRLPANSSPYTSTIIFVVRKGNPRGIKDWDDLVKPGVTSIAPNPKTGGGARWVYLAAWAYAKEKSGTEAGAKDFVKKLYSQIPILDSGARGSTLTFAQNHQGDVLLAWENETHLAVKEFAADGLEIVTPSSSILAEPAVALVDKTVDKHGTREAAQAYLQFLYTNEAQDVIARNWYRPATEYGNAKYAAQFPAIKLATIADFGGWAKAQKEHFDDGGIFDQIHLPGSAAPKLEQGKAQPTPGKP